MGNPCIICPFILFTRTQPGRQSQVLTLCKAIRCWNEKSTGQAVKREAGYKVEKKQVQVRTLEDAVETTQSVVASELAQVGTVQGTRRPSSGS